LRFMMPMFPDASAQLMWLVFALSMIAVVYTSLVALVQSDMKKLIAYSSVAHMAIVTAGLFAFNQQGIEGALIIMLSHGVVSAALFFCRSEERRVGKESRFRWAACACRGVSVNIDLASYAG